MSLTQVWVVMIVGLIVSALLAFVPGINSKWEQLTREIRARIVVLVCFALALGAFVLSCFGILVGSDAYCPDYTNPATLVTAAYDILMVALAAAGAVQTAYQFGLKPTSDWLKALGEPDRG